MPTEYDYDREADEIDEINKEEAMKQKLVAPNGNYEIANCRNCSKEYVKRLNNSTKQLAPGIRGWRMKNCSKRCTMESKRKSSNAEKTSKVKTILESVIEEDKLHGINSLTKQNTNRSEDGD